MKTALFLFLSIFFLSSCGSTDSDGVNTVSHQEDSHGSAADSHEPFGYNLNAPDKIYSLPGNLNEVSGLQYTANNLVACIQDEDGIVFFFDLKSGQIVKELKWGVKGDYEGIAGNADTLYVLKSNGTLFQLSQFTAAGSFTLKEWKMDLGKKCDAEGICLLSDENVLLVACKEGKKGERILWKFDVRTETVLKEPYKRIYEKQVEDKLVETGLDQFSLGLKKFLSAKTESGVLSPSGIAQHPLTKQLFILSSRSHLLLVLSKQGEVENIVELTTEHFSQPESITFLPDGTLLIGNEASGRKPTILLFNYESES